MVPEGGEIKEILQKAGAKAWQMQAFLFVLINNNGSQCTNKAHCEQ